MFSRVFFVVFANFVMVIVCLFHSTFLASKFFPQDLSWHCF